MRVISLFSGIEGFGLGLERAGMQVVAQVEIDPGCRNNVLARHFPDVPRCADIKELDPHDLPAADLVCGGFPCQDISVAGRRAGLAGARSGLWWEFHRVLAALRPRWVVIENVPGLLSSNNGRDMGAILGALGDLGYGWAYRVLDAQHFGLAQRRRRVFIVGCLGDRAAPVQVLLEPEGGQGHPAPRRTAGQRVAYTLTGGSPAARRTSPAERRAEDDVNLVVARTLAIRGREGGAQAELGGEVANGLRAGDGGSSRQPLILASTLRSHPRPGSNSDGAVTVGPLLAGSPDSYRIGADEAASGQLVVGALTGGAVHGGADDNDAQAGHLIATAITAREHKGPDSDVTSGNLVTHALTAEGADASEDGTGRGTPLVVTPLRANGAVGANGAGIGREGDPGLTLDTGGSAAVAFGISSDALDRSGEGASGTPGDRAGLGIVQDASPALRSRHPNAVADASAVRRLTPTECERLQGFPDGWTAGQPDSVRYRQLGNAVAVPVAAWIGRRIVAQEVGP